MKLLPLIALSVAAFLSSCGRLHPGWRRCFASAILCVLGFMMGRHNVFRWNLTNANITSLAIGSFLLFALSTAMLISMRKKERDLTFSPPSWRQPIFQCRNPLQEVFDSAILTVSVGLGVGVQCLYDTAELPRDAILIVAWGVGMFTGVKIAEKQLLGKQ